MKYKILTVLAWICFILVSVGPVGYVLTWIDKPYLTMMELFLGHMHYFVMGIVGYLGLKFLNAYCE